MNNGIYISWDMIIGTTIAILLAIIGWFISYFLNFNKKFYGISDYLNKINNENSKRDVQIEFLLKKVYPIFIEKEKINVSKRKN